MGITTGLLLCALAPTGVRAQPEAETPCSALPPAEEATGDCVIDVNGFLMHFKYAEEDTPTRVTVTQTDRYGDQLSEIEKYDVREALWPPVAREITGDGRMDVLLPLFVEDGNTTFKVYQPDAEGTLFASGEISAIGPEAVRGVDGLTIAVTSAGPDILRETAFAPDEWDGFDMVYVLEADATRQICSLVEENDLSSFGLSPEEIVANCEARSW